MMNQLLTRSPIHNKIPRPGNLARQRRYAKKKRGNGKCQSANQCD